MLSDIVFDLEAEVSKMKTNRRRRIISNDLNISIDDSNHSTTHIHTPKELHSFDFNAISDSMKTEKVTIQARQRTG
jgi:hypothetical protein